LHGCVNSILKDSAHDEERTKGKLDLSAMKSGVAELLLGR
jgi:hypothetical protein